MYRFQIYRRLTLRGYRYFWRMRSVRNGQVVATGGESYHNLGDVTEIVGKIQLNAALADVEIN